MPFSIPPYRRFPTHCAVMYMAGPCIDATITASGHDLG